MMASIKYSRRSPTSFGVPGTAVVEGLARIPSAALELEGRRRSRPSIWLKVGVAKARAFGGMALN